MSKDDKSLHTRYYASRVTFGLDGVATKIVYRTSTGDWTEEFTKAQLWDCPNFLRTKIAEWLKINKRFPWVDSSSVGFVLGSVIVQADPFFPLESFR